MSKRVGVMFELGLVPACFFSHDVDDDVIRQTMLCFSVFKSTGTI